MFSFFVYVILITELARFTSWTERKSGNY